MRTQGVFPSKPDRELPDASVHGDSFAVLTLIYVSFPCVRQVIFLNRPGWTRIESHETQSSRPDIWQGDSILPDLGAVFGDLCLSRRHFAFLQLHTKRQQGHDSHQI